MSHVPETEPSLPPPRPASFAPPAAVDGAPPVTERDGNQGLMSAQPSAMAIHYAGTPAARRRTLTSGWRWVLACGWGTVMAGIGVIANTGFILGDPPFWTGNGLAVLPFVAPVVVLVALAADWRYEIALSFAAAAATAAIGIIDLFHAPPMGLGELVFAFVALLVTVAAMAGLVPHDD